MNNIFVESVHRVTQGSCGVQMVVLQLLRVQQIMRVYVLCSEETRDIISIIELEIHIALEEQSV